MSDFTIHISLADLALCVTLVRALIVTSRWIIRKIVIYIWNIWYDLQYRNKRE